MFTSVLLAASLVGDGKAAESPPPLMRLFNDLNLLILRTKGYNGLSKLIGQLKEMVADRPGLADVWGKSIMEYEQAQKRIASRYGDHLSDLATDGLRTFLPILAPISDPCP
jgi:hypothetical protein